MAPYPCTITIRSLFLDYHIDIAFGQWFPNVSCPESFGELITERLNRFDVEPSQVHLYKVSKGGMIQMVHRVHFWESSSRFWKGTALILHIHSLIQCMCWVPAQWKISCLVLWRIQSELNTDFSFQEIKDIMREICHILHYLWILKINEWNLLHVMHSWSV